MKQNCWEAKQCGRGPGAADGRVCPAATERRLDGQNDGRNAGRACWVVAGTLCGGEPQGRFAQKLETCISCSFYADVKREEAAEWVPSGRMLRMMRPG